MSKKLKPCDACGHMIAENSNVTCPNCGKVYKKSNGCFTVILWIIAISMILGALGNIIESFSGSSTESMSSSTTYSSTEETPTVVPEPEDNRTMGQKQASQKAESYINYQAFSARGLYDQLVFEGFSKEDSEYAVNNLSVDWNEQAAKKAQDYINLQSYSKQGLIDQLVFEGFSKEQAKYGVSQVGY